MTDPQQQAQQMLAAQIEKNKRMFDKQMRDQAVVMERQRQRDVAAAYGKIIPFSKSDFLTPYN